MKNTCKYEHISIQCRCISLFLYLRSRLLLTLPIAIQRRDYIIKRISDYLTSVVYIVLAPNLRTGVIWPRVLKVMIFFAICWLQKYLDFILNWLSCFHHSTCDIIPKLSINMETYPHLVSSQIPHILLYTFIQYKNNHCVLNILYSTVKTLAADIILPINNITKN
jgi:hypothetical protein